MADPYAGIAAEEGASAADPYAGIAAPEQVAAPRGAPATPYDITGSVDPSFAAAHPVTGELGVGLQNMAIGLGARIADVPLRMRQLYGAITGSPSLDPEVQAKRAVDVPIMHTYGGQIGHALPAAAAGAAAGTSVPLSALYAGIVGASQPTTSTDFGGHLGATAINAGTSAAAAAAGTYAGNKIAGWATERAEYPVSGYTPGSVDTRLARAVGSRARQLNQAAIGDRADEFRDIFNAGRNAATDIDLAATPAAIDQLTSNLNPSVRPLVENNPNVQDLISHATGSGTVNGQMLGRISTGLRQDASAALNSEGGNREVGLALQQLREHVEDQITSNIADPATQAAYTAARSQYGLFQDVRYNPSLLNPATGEAKGEALARYAQRNYPGYTTGAAVDDSFFNALTWAARGGGAKGAPPLTLMSPWKPLTYAVTHNPGARLAGGLASRPLAFAAPGLPSGLGAISAGSGSALLPYLEE